MCGVKFTRGNLLIKGKPNHDLGHRSVRTNVMQYLAPSEIVQLHSSWQWFGKDVGQVSLCVHISDPLHAVIGNGAGLLVERRCR